jgi:hypothetical protein
VPSTRCGVGTAAVGTPLAKDRATESGNAEVAVGTALTGGPYRDRVSAALEAGKAAQDPLPRPAAHVRGAAIVGRRTPKVVQQRLGHVRFSVAMDTYSHVLPGRQREAAAEFDEILAGKMG